MGVVELAVAEEPEEGIDEIRRGVGRHRRAGFVVGERLVAQRPSQHLPQRRDLLAGAFDPRRLADQLTLIIDGLYSSGPMAGTRGPAAVAVALADDLVRASCGPPRGTDQAPSDEAAQRVR